MTTPGQEFAEPAERIMGAVAVQVSELDRLAAALPAVADALRPPIALLSEHTPTPRPEPVATAEALHDIAQVYRRVDGQG